MTLRILHVGKYFPPQRGGMESYLADLIGAQRAQGIDACALVHGDPLPGDPDWLVRVPVEFHLSYAPMALGFRSALARAIKRFEPDVLHLHMPNNSAFWALTLPAARRLPWVVHWHSDVVVSKIKTTIAAAYWLYRPLELSLLSRCERIIVTSPPYLEASEPLEFWRYKCAVVPMGLAIQEPVRDGAASRPPWHGDGLRLLSIGRLAYYKGFGTLIQAVAKLPGVQLIIAGDGPQRAELQALVASLARAGEPPRVTLLGEVSEADKHALLSSCDLFCLASRERTEAFGLVLFEAMHHGKPCLVSDLPGSGMPWLVQQAGAGWLAPAENAEAWQAAIAQCAALPDERHRRGLAGQHALRTRFTLQASARSISELYATLIDETPIHKSARSNLVVIPVRNAAMPLATTLEALRRLDDTDILVVDDHSQDNSVGIARAAGAAVLRPPLRMTPWIALQAGLRFGLAHAYRTVVVMNANEQPPIAALQLLLDQRQRADLVVGVLQVPGPATQPMSARRLPDLGGFDLSHRWVDLRCYNRAALRVLSSAAASLLDYEEPGSRLMLREAGLSVVEMTLPSADVKGTHKKTRAPIYQLVRHGLLTALTRLSYWPHPRKPLSR